MKRDDIYDLAAEAERRASDRQRAIEYADDDTRQIRRQIEALSLTERHVFALLSCIQSRVAESTWSHTDTASAVHDGICDCVGALESSMEKHL